MTTQLVRGQAVGVQLGEQGAVAARVVSAFGERVVVALAAPPELEGARLAGTLVQILVTTARGLLRVPAVVLSADAAGVVEVDLADTAQLDQRREHVRVLSRLPVVIERADEAQAPLHTYTLDVSGGGVLVAGTGLAEPGTPVDVSLRLPGRGLLEAGGRVARRTADGHAGVVFDAIAPADREDLVRWIFERQRLERAQAKGLA